MAIIFRNMGRCWMATMVALAGVTLGLGCRSVPPRGASERFHFNAPHMGTMFAITLFATDADTARRAADAAFARIAELDRKLTDYDPQSELMQLCRRPAGTPVAVSADLFEALRRAQDISERSEGAFDVTVGPYVHLWRTARKSRILPSSEELAEAKQRVGFRKLHLNARRRTVTMDVPGMRLDLGGIGKGFAADAGLRVLRQHNIRQALVAASGDLAIGDPPPGKPGWSVAISSLGSEGAAPAKVMVLRNVGVSTSGDAEQFVEIGGVRYSHIVDPRTGIGLIDRLQTTVVAPDGTASDGLAKVVCVLGVERGFAIVERVPGAAALVLKPGAGGQQIVVSPRFGTLRMQP